MVLPTEYRRRDLVAQLIYVNLALSTNLVVLLIYSLGATVDALHILAACHVSLTFVATTPIVP